MGMCRGTNYPVSSIALGTIVTEGVFGWRYPREVRFTLNSRRAGSLEGA